MASDAYESYRRGIELLESGRPAEALGFLEQANAAEPKKASIQEALGRAYFNVKRVAEAKNSFKEALAIDPSNDYAHFGLATCLERLGENQLAFGHVKMALAMSPENKDYQRLALRLEMRALSSED